MSAIGSSRQALNPSQRTEIIDRIALTLDPTIRNSDLRQISNRRVSYDSLASAHIQTGDYAVWPEIAIRTHIEYAGVGHTKLYSPTLVTKNINFVTKWDNVSITPFPRMREFSVPLEIEGRTASAGSTLGFYKFGVSMNIQYAMTPHGEKLMEDKITQILAMVYMTADMITIDGIVNLCIENNLRIIKENRKGNSKLARNLQNFIMGNPFFGNKGVQSLKDTLLAASDLGMNFDTMLVGSNFSIVNSGPNPATVNYPVLFDGRTIGERSASIVMEDTIDIRVKGSTVSTFKVPTFQSNLTTKIADPTDTRHPFGSVFRGRNPNLMPHSMHNAGAIEIRDMDTSNYDTKSFSPIDALRHSVYYETETGYPSNMSHRLAQRANEAGVRPTALYPNGSVTKYSLADEETEGGYSRRQQKFDRSWEGIDPMLVFSRGKHYVPFVYGDFRLSAVPTAVDIQMVKKIARCIGRDTKVNPIHELLRFMKKCDDTKATDEMIAAMRAVPQENKDTSKERNKAMGVPYALQGETDPSTGGVIIDLKDVDQKYPTGFSTWPLLAMFAELDDGKVNETLRSARDELKPIVKKIQSKIMPRFEEIFKESLVINEKEAPHWHGSHPQKFARFFEFLYKDYCGQGLFGATMVARNEYDLDATHPVNDDTTRTFFNGNGLTEEVINTADANSVQYGKALEKATGLGAEILNKVIAQIHYTVVDYSDDEKDTIAKKMFTLVELNGLSVKRIMDDVEYEPLQRLRNSLNRGAGEREPASLTLNPNFLSEYPQKKHTVKEGVAADPENQVAAIDEDPSALLRLPIRFCDGFINYMDGVERGGGSVYAADPSTYYTTPINDPKTRLDIRKKKTGSLVDDLSTKMALTGARITTPMFSFARPSGKGNVDIEDKTKFYGQDTLASGFVGPWQTRYKALDRLGKNYMTKAVYLMLLFTVNNVDNFEVLYDECGVCPFVVEAIACKQNLHCQPAMFFNRASRPFVTAFTAPTIGKDVNAVTDSLKLAVSFYAGHVQTGPNNSIYHPYAVVTGMGRGWRALVAHTQEEMFNPNDDRDIILVPAPIFCETAQPMRIIHTPHTPDTNGNSPSSLHPSIGMLTQSFNGSNINKTDKKFISVTAFNGTVGHATVNGWEIVGGNGPVGGSEMSGRQGKDVFAGLSSTFALGDSPSAMIQ